MKKKKHKVYSRTKKRTIKTALKSYENSDGTRKESSIECKIRLHLEKQNIPFVQEKYINHNGKWKSYDFLISDGLNYTFFVECDGDFWHDPNGTHKIQKKNIRNDKLKDKIAKHIGIPLLRFSESEIKFQFESIIKKIQEEIDRQTK